MARQPLSGNSCSSLVFGLLCAVPVFKTLTHLPPFMGVLFALGILWLFGELIHGKKPDEDKEHLTLASALQRIDMGSLVFFIGILLSVATLEHSHILSEVAQWLDKAVGNRAMIVSIFGLASAIVDNVPLVAAAMGMYSLSHFPTDSFLWEFLAYTAGTGGSILIIGSAAGVAAMGIEKIEFFVVCQKNKLARIDGLRWWGARLCLRKHDEIGLGTILGSNIFNGLFIIGAAASIHPIQISWEEVVIGFSFGLMTTAVTLPLSGNMIARGRGVILISLYVAYLLALLQLPMVL